MSLVLSRAAVLTMDRQSRVLSPADIRIEGNRIAAISAVDTLAGAGDEIIDCREALVLPGFVNTHTHLCAGLFRGMAEDVSRESWGADYRIPGQERFELADYLLSARLACQEQLLNGVTCVADRWSNMDMIAEEIAASGLRAIVGHTLTDQSNAAEWSLAEALIERWGVSPAHRITAGLAPRAPDACADEMLRRCARTAERHGCRVFIHVAQSEGEIAKLRERGHDGALACLESNGLAGAHVVAAHCIYLSAAEIARWPASRIAIAHCPASNLKIEARTLAIHRLIHKAAIGIGTDWAASDNAMDVFAEMRLAALVGKLLADDPTALPVETMLRLATIGGARALGLDGVIGSIEPGKLADLVVLDLTRVEANPTHNLAANVLYSMGARCVRDVIVDGVVLVRDGKPTRVDIAALRREMAQRALAARRS
jgi:5-methylthioadenosine/S-adenosylhomocysteine deaminase